MAYRINVKLNDEILTWRRHIQPNSGWQFKNREYGNYSLCISLTTRKNSTQLSRMFSAMPEIAFSTLNIDLTKNSCMNNKPRWEQLGWMVPNRTRSAPGARLQIHPGAMLLPLHPGRKEQFKRSFWRNPLPRPANGKHALNIDIIIT